jgi:rhodanese-related sulfurtransferase
MEHLLQYIGHHPLLATFAAAAALAVLVNELRLQAQQLGALAPQDAIRLMNQGAAVVDLRAADEFAAGHISGARNIPAADIGNAAADALKRYKERPVVLYCERGSSAAGAVRTLAAQGFAKVFNLRGGLAAWRAENLPLARD